MPFAEVNGVRLFYQQVGEGPDLVMVHGLAANHAFWFNRIGYALKRRFRLTLLDLRGHGRSAMPAHGYTSLDMAQDLAGLLDRLEITRMILVGHSFGGNVALQYTAQHPQRVASLVLADTRIYALQPAQRLDDQPLSSLEERLLEGADIDPGDEEHIGLRLLEEWVVQKKDDAPGMPGMPGAALVPFVNDSAGSRTNKRFLELVRATSAREDIRAMAGLTRERLGSIAVPVLAVYGQRSRCLPSGVALAEMLDACSLTVVPGAGHFHPLSRPDVFLRAIVGFLRRLRRAAKAASLAAAPAGTAHLQAASTNTTAEVRGVNA